MAEHRPEFHRELEAIEAKVIDLFGMVAEDVPRATTALLGGDVEEVQRWRSVTGLSTSSTRGSRIWPIGSLCCSSPWRRTCAS